MHKITTLFFIALYLISSNSFTQAFYIKGQIISTMGGNPVSEASVSLSQIDKTTSSDANGNFEFTNLLSGKYELIVSCIGYERTLKQITLTKNFEVKITLTPSVINLAEVTVRPNKSIPQSESVTGIDKLLRPVNTAQDLLRLVPGLFIAQHAGGGKAEQIFVRGFDCDHGTDFNISVDGLPVNMVSHAHGQGYADFHFVIPETIDKLNVYKGPYSARFGDFATAGAAEFFTKNQISQNEIKAEVGMFDTYRTFGIFNLLDKKHLFSKEKEYAYVAGEYVFTNSYFDNKQHFGRYNMFGKYNGLLNENNRLTLLASTFSGKWNASGQIPERAVSEGLIDRFGSIDSSEGGQTQRTNASAVLTTTTKNSAVIKNQLYYTRYFFNLFSNFIFFLNDSIHGDEIEQTDNRNILGYNFTYQQDYFIKNRILHTTVGIGIRNDITDISLRHTEKKVVLDTIAMGYLYQQNSNAFLDLVMDITDRFSINGGLRADYFLFNYTDQTNKNESGIKFLTRVSPKLSFNYSVNDNLRLFLKTGIGFHSNDARSVVLNHSNFSLPKAYGTDMGSEFKLGKHVFASVALWQLYLQSELVYVGDEGTTETNNPTQRFGTDLSIRCQLTKFVFADADLNFSHGRLTGPPKGENYIPLAPRLTSTGGITYKREKGFNAGIRYRTIDSRAANETYSVTAKGYFLLDAAITYSMSKFEIGISAENLLNSQWNQAQFDTQSRLYNETSPMSELHFTPGTPFCLKGMITIKF